MFSRFKKRFTPFFNTFVGKVFTNCEAGGNFAPEKTI